MGWDLSGGFVPKSDRILKCLLSILCDIHNPRMHTLHTIHSLCLVYIGDRNRWPAPRDLYRDLHAQSLLVSVLYRDLRLTAMLEQYGYLFVGSTLLYAHESISKTDASHFLSTPYSIL